MAVEREEIGRGLVYIVLLVVASQGWMLRRWHSRASRIGRAEADLEGDGDEHSRHWGRYRIAYGDRLGELTETQRIGCCGVRDA